MNTNDDLLTQGLGEEDPTPLLTSGLARPDTTPNPPNALETVMLEPPPDLALGSPVISNNVSPLLSTRLPKNPPLDFESWRKNPPSFNVPILDFFHTYSGSDMRVMLEVCGVNEKPKQLVEVVTLTVSSHREKAPVRSLGYINPKAFARGNRTIAGTMILTQFNMDFLFQFLGAEYGKDVSKDTTYYKIDQLPPFNLTLMFADDYGNASYRRLLGCDMVTDGVVYSTNDMLTEQSLTYMASDFTMLMPTVSDSVSQTTDRRSTGNERSARDVLRDRLQQKRRV